MSDTLRELSLAWRRLHRSPVFTISATLTLAIGIGSAVAIFAVVNGVILKSLPFGHAERLVSVWLDSPVAALDHSPHSTGTYLTFSRLARTIDGIGAYLQGSANLDDPEGVLPPRRVEAARITANLLPVLEVAPKLGRPFTGAEDSPGGEPVAIIGEGLWHDQFGSDRDILLKSIDVDGVARRIVGVMPEEFRFPGSRTDLWLPLALNPNAPFTGGFGYSAIARLKPLVTREDATREFAALLPRSTELFPNLAPGVSLKSVFDQMKPTPDLVSLKEDIVGPITGSLTIVAATAGLLLLVACANVANLILVRADGRQREMAIRRVLGGGRRQLIAYFAGEGVVLAALAGTLGLAIAAVGVRLLVRAAPVEIPRLAEVRIDPLVAGFALLLIAGVALVAGGVPAARYGRIQLAGALREAGRGGTAGRHRQRIRGSLVAVQVALAVVLLGGSALLGRSFQRLRAVQPGFEPAHVAATWMTLTPARYPTNADVTRFCQQVIDRVQELPGVAAVGVTSRLPLLTQGLDDVNPPYVENHPTATQSIPPLQMFEATDGGYFAAMRIPLIAGRTFDRIDGRQRGNEVIVSREIARRYWNDSTGAAAIGKRLRTVPTGPPFTIVGVVGSIRDTSLSTPPAGTVYFAEATDSGVGRVRRTVALVVRTAGDPAAALPAIQSAVHELDPTLPLYDQSSLSAIVDRSTAQLRFVMLILGVASAVTLLLSGIGLYGVIAYVVTLRTRELGVRLALGGRPRQIAAMVTRQGLTLAAAGIAIGMVVFVFAARFLRSLLFEIQPADPASLAAVAAVLVLVAALASWIPARRASRVDPVEALRAE